MVCTSTPTLPTRHTTRTFSLYRLRRDQEPLGTGLDIPRGQRERLIEIQCWEVTDCFTSHTARTFSPHGLRGALELSGTTLDILRGQRERLIEIQCWEIQCWEMTRYRLGPLELNVLLWRVAWLVTAAGPGETESSERQRQRQSNPFPTLDFD